MKRLVGLAMLCLLVLSCGDDEKTPEAAPAAPSALVINTRDVYTVPAAPSASGIRVTGSLNAANQVEIKSQFSGQLDRVTVKEGDRVAAGQVLAVFDAAAARAQLAAARAALAGAERDYGAASMLHKAGAVSEQDAVRARVAREAAEAQVVQAQEMAGNATVTAPISGTITEQQVERGEVVQPGMTMMSIANIGELELQGAVPAEQIGGVRLGQPVSITLDAYPGRVVQGRVARIEAVADPQTRQVNVYIRVPNPGGDLVGGLFATGTIVTNLVPQERGLSVPATAIRRDGATAVVCVIAGGRIAARQVSTGGSDPERGTVTITSGLASGERILASPSDDVRPGTAVRIE